MGGGGLLSIVGQGLEGAEAEICGAPCTITGIEAEPLSVHAGEDYQMLHCSPTAFKQPIGRPSYPIAPDIACELRMTKAGQTVVVPEAWTYKNELTPIIRSVTAEPAEDKPTTVQVNGDGFVAPTTVLVGEAPCAVTDMSDDYVTCTLPAGIPAVGEVTVKSAGVRGAVSAHVEANVLFLPTTAPQLQSATFSSFTNALCRKSTVDFDCAAGWQCCGVAELSMEMGHCASTCAESFLAVRSIRRLVSP